MLSKLKKYIYPSTPVIIPKWTQHLRSLKVRIAEIKRRYLNSYGHDSRSLVTLKHILNFIDFDYLKYQSTDFDAYTNYFSEFGPNADYIFNPTKFGKAYKKMFYHKNSSSVCEYIVPTSDKDYIKYLPLGKSWEEWKYVKPVTLWYNDSNELTTNLLYNQVSYKYDQPTIAITYIDSISLAMMWYKYLRTEYIPTEEKTEHIFLQKYVFSKLFDDLVDIWTLNRICNLISQESSYELSRSDDLYGYTGGRIIEANMAFLEQLDRLKNGNIRPVNILSSELFINNSLLSKIHYGIEQLATPHLHQYEYIRLLQFLPYIELLIKIYHFRPDSSEYRMLARDMQIILTRYLQSKPWSTMIGTTTKSYLQNKIETLYQNLSLYK